MKVRARYLVAGFPATVEPPPALWRDGFLIPPEGVELDVPADILARWKSLPELAIEPSEEAPSRKGHK